MQPFLDMDRRVLMRNVALLLGAASIPTLAGCKAAMEGKGTLNEEQMKLLIAIADTIIPETDTPGAVAAGVPKLLSGMLRISPILNRQSARLCWLNMTRQPFSLVRRPKRNSQASPR
jgi:hypothetical protein